ncbi:MAG: DUF503 domain-containing protein [Clostridiaceae bacterium]|nr:DUF503 domain-containing protein [Clostridiaceae bacterium]
MVIGICKVCLTLYDVFSLKDKRSVIKSIIDRVKARYNASIAEVGMNDAWKSAVLGVACISNDSAHVDRMIEEIIRFIENDGRIEIVDYSTEKIHINST